MPGIRSGSTRRFDCTCRQCRRTWWSADWRLSRPARSTRAPNSTRLVLLLLLHGHSCVQLSGHVTSLPRQPTYYLENKYFRNWKIALTLIHRLYRKKYKSRNFCGQRKLIYRQALPTRNFFCLSKRRLVRQPFFWLASCLAIIWYNFNIKVKKESITRDKIFVQTRYFFGGQNSGLRDRQDVVLVDTFMNAKPWSAASRCRHSNG
jgi:hypothetical protein